MSDISVTITDAQPINTVVADAQPINVSLGEAVNVYSGAGAAPVQSVNGKTGAIVLTATDVGADATGAAATAQTNAESYTDNKVAAIDFPVDSVNAKTGAVVLDKTDVGLGNVDNTSDLAKPISTTTQTALNTKVDKVTGKTLSTEDYTTADQTKLAGIATGATANQTDAYLLSRANHTGTQAISTVTDLQTALDAKEDAASAFSGSYDDLTGKPTIPTDNASLTNGAGYLTTETDPVFTASPAHSLTTGNLTTLANTSGTNTGDETATTIKTKLGITTLSGSNTGDQTTITGNAGTATKLATARTINGVSFDGTANITVADSTKVPTTTTVNGHALSANVTVSKSDVGLGNVDNTSDASKPISTAMQTALNGKVNGSVTITVGTTAPTAPALNDLWVDMN